MSEIVQNVNWLAVVVGAVVAYALGWLWYGPLFGKAWSTGLGISVPEKMPVGAMLLQAAGTFLLAWLFGVTAARDALWTIILVVLTIIALMAAGGLFSQRPARVIWIEIGYVFAMAVVLFLAQAVF